jgi:D-sedoheptulose 7-phosphate isomerase
MKTIFFEKYFNLINTTVISVNKDKLIAVSDLVKDVAIKGKKIIVVGNGGSAAMASHIAVDFTKAARVRAVNFNEADLITCFANDYGYEQWVVEALNAYADSGDLVILISSSGKSPNIVNGAIQAKKMGLKVVTLSGFGIDNPLRKLGDIEFWADSADYNVVEMSHHIWLLAIVDYFIEANKKEFKV